MVRGSENLENFKLRAVAAAAGQTFIDVGGRSRQAEAAGVDESLIASWWCATYFFARITAFFTGDAVGCQKTVMLFSPFPRNYQNALNNLLRDFVGHPFLTIPLSSQVPRELLDDEVDTSAAYGASGEWAGRVTVGSCRQLCHSLQIYRR